MLNPRPFSIDRDCQVSKHAAYFPRFGRQLTRVTPSHRVKRRETRKGTIMKLHKYLLLVPALVLSLMLAANTTFAAIAIEYGQPLASGAGLTPPADGTAILDPNVQVSTDGVNWTPAYTANIGYPTPIDGSNWDFPSANPFAGYGNPQTIYYQVTFVLPPGAAAS